MWEILGKLIVAQGFKNLPKCKKSPSLVTLHISHLSRTFVPFICLNLMYYLHPPTAVLNSGYPLPMIYRCKLTICEKLIRVIIMLHGCASFSSLLRLSGSSGRE